MWRPPPITGDNLRLIVRDAPQGVEIIVPPGEFEGPLVFDRPLRLVGGGAHSLAVTLWTRRGPALIVRSAGVVVTNVNVELTQASQSDVFLWFAAGCQPDTQGAQIQGRMEQMGTSHSGGGWNLPDLIDLGDLRAKYPVSLPMVIGVPGPARLRGELSALVVQPTKLPAGGEHLIQVGIPGAKLLNNTMLAGQIVIESAGETRAIWIIGRVLEDEFKAWAKDKIILINKRGGHKIGFASSMLLGREQLQGEAGADQVAEKQAYILKEASGVWSLIQPLAVSQPTLVDGQPVGVGRRRLLKGGEVIKIGSLELKVEASKTDLPIVADGSVDFGKLSTRGTTPPPVVTVQNKQRRKWQGTLRSTVPWVQVPQTQVVCPGGQSVQVPVQLADLTGLPKQDVRYTGALVLAGNKERWIIGARLDVDVEQGLSVEPGVLDFGRVSRASATPPQQVRLCNSGQSDWQGSLRVIAPWLAVDQTDLQCIASGQTTFEVRLTDQIATLPKGPHTLAEALKIEGQGLSVSVAARLVFDKPQVRLDVQPRSIDWGQVMDWRSAQPQTIQLQNTGDKDWRGKAESKTPWLETSPTSLHCPAQGQTTLTVRLTDHFERLQTGELEAPAAVRIEGQGLAFAILARVEVQAPQIRPDTTQIDLVLADRMDLPSYALRLKNLGSQAWRGQVKSTLRWLLINPSDVVIPPSGETVVGVMLGPEVSVFKRARVVSVDNAIRIESAGHVVLVGVRLEIIKPAPRGSIPMPAAPPKPAGAEPAVAAPDFSGLMVDFGVVTDLSGSLPVREIRLSNSQPQEIKGTVRSTLPWLEVTPKRFSCPASSEVLLKVGLKEARALRPKIYDVADALIIKCGDKEHKVKARLQVARARPSPLPGIKPSPVTKPVQKTQPPTTMMSGLSVDFGVVTDMSGPLPVREIRLRNSQPQEIKGVVRSTLPWLKVTPKRFSCPAGGKVLLKVELKGADTLRPKTYDVADALIIESGDKQHKVKARLQIARARPSPQTRVKPSPVTKPVRQKVQPAAAMGGLSVDFGTVTDWSGPLPVREIRLSNSQAQEMTGVVRSTLPWLAVTPKRFSCPAGGEVLLKVELKEARTLRPKIYDVADALIIKCGDKEYKVKARLQVARVSPARPSPRPRPSGLRTIKAGPPVSDLFKPDQTESKKVKPDERPASSTRPEVQKKEGVESIRPEVLMVKPNLIDWGEVSSWDEALPTREIQLSNDLKTDWSGRVRSTVPWMQVSSGQVACAAGETLTLKVSLTRHIARLRPRTYSANNALVIEGQDTKLRVEARLIVSRA